MTRLPADQQHDPNLEVRYRSLPSLYSHLRVVRYEEPIAVADFGQGQGPTCAVLRRTAGVVASSANICSERLTVGRRWCETVGRARKACAKIPLDRLARSDPLEVQLIEMRYFGGMTAEESAAMVHVVRLQLRLAQVWLRKETAG
jgi:hypothetical protein